MKGHLIEKKNEPLYPEEISEVTISWRESSDDEILSSLSCEQVDGRSLRMLQPNCWLNDKIINFYMALLNERSKVLYRWTKSKRSYFFYSYFLGALIDSEGMFTYSKVRDWTSNINIFKAEKLFFQCSKKIIGCLL